MSMNVQRYAEHGVKEVWREGEERTKWHSGHPHNFRSVMDADGCGEAHRDLCKKLEHHEGPHHFRHDPQVWPAFVSLTRCQRCICINMISEDALVERTCSECRND